MSVSKTSNNTKIDNEAVLGLQGTNNSLAYKVHEIGRHFHNRAKWFGEAATPSGETHVADRVGGATTTFTLTSGNSDFGSWVQILGSADTPVCAGCQYYDGHEYLVTSTSATATYIVQLAIGESLELADRITNEEFSEVLYVAASNLNDSGVGMVMGSRLPSGSKLWARCACIGQNAKTIDFYIGLHEYEG
jgi:hypothetical protein